VTTAASLRMRINQMRVGYQSQNREGALRLTYSARRARPRRRGDRIGTAQPGGIGGRIINWFADKSPPGTVPTGVAVIDGANSASIARGGW